MVVLLLAEPLSKQYILKQKQKHNVGTAFSIFLVDEIIQFNCAVYIKYFKMYK